MMGVVTLAARFGIRSILVYVVFGVLMWFFFHESGVHATIGGVIFGLMTPAKSLFGRGPFGEFVQRSSRVLPGGVGVRSRTSAAEVLHLRRSGARNRVSFGVSGKRAQSLGGVCGDAAVCAGKCRRDVSADGLQSPVAMAVMAGLVLGKPLGIVLASWISVRSGLAQLPQSVSGP